MTSAYSVITSCWTFPNSLLHIDAWEYAEETGVLLVIVVVTMLPNMKEAIIAMLTITLCFSSSFILITYL